MHRASCDYAQPVAAAQIDRTKCNDLNASAQVTCSSVEVP